VSAGRRSGAHHERHQRGDPPPRHGTCSSARRQTSSAGSSSRPQSWQVPSDPTSTRKRSRRCARRAVVAHRVPAPPVGFRARSAWYTRCDSADRRGARDDPGELRWASGHHRNDRWADDAEAGSDTWGCRQCGRLRCLRSCPRHDRNSLQHQLWRDSRLGGYAEAREEEYMAGSPYTGPLTVINGRNFSDCMVASWRRSISASGRERSSSSVSW
jgi:hypothetical protein